MNTATCDVCRGEDWTDIERSSDTYHGSKTRPDSQAVLEIFDDSVDGDLVSCRSLWPCVVLLLAMGAAPASAVTTTITPARNTSVVLRSSTAAVMALRASAARCHATLHVSAPTARKWTIRLAARRTANRSLGRMGGTDVRLRLRITGPACARITVRATATSASARPVGRNTRTRIGAGSPLAVKGPAPASSANPPTSAGGAARPASPSPQVSGSVTAIPAASPTGLADFVGISSHLFWFGRSYVEARLAQIRDAGMHWIRDDFNWPQIEPRRGVYDWTKTDIVMGAAARADVDVLANLTYSPTWASSDPSGNGSRYYPPQRAADYGTVAAAVAARYGVGGSFWSAHPELPARPLRALELWNEPWYKQFWAPNPDPAAYSRLVRAAAASVGTGRGVELLMSGDNLSVSTDGVPRPWLDSIIRDDPGLLALVDGLTVHPYPQPFGRSPTDTTGDPRWRFDRVPAAGAAAAAAGHPLPVWITEIGWSTAPARDGGVTEAQQASYLLDAINIAAKSWAGAVSHVFLYTLNDVPTDTDPLHQNYGLMYADGSPKPAWLRLKTLLTASN